MDCVTWDIPIDITIHCNSTIMYCNGLCYMGYPNRYYNTLQCNTIPWDVTQ